MVSGNITGCLACSDIDEFSSLLPILSMLPLVSRIGSSVWIKLVWETHLPLLRHSSSFEKQPLCMGTLVSLSASWISWTLISFEFWKVSPFLSSHWTWATIPQLSWDKTNLSISWWVYQKDENLQHMWYYIWVWVLHHISVIMDCFHIVSNHGSKDRKSVWQCTSFISITLNAIAYHSSTCWNLS